MLNEVMLKSVSMVFSGGFLVDFEYEMRPHDVFMCDPEPVKVSIENRDTWEINVMMCEYEKIIALRDFLVYLGV